MKTTVTKLFPSGALEVCAVVSGQLIRRRYFGYSRREAIRLFRANLKA
jgi:predicted deacylase